MNTRKYTANYTYTNPNFVIQNLVKGNVPLEQEQLFCVLLNILQRGFPTTLSKYLQKQIASLHEMDDFDTRFLFINPEPVHWHDTIKGDEVNNYYPAKIFFEQIISNEFGEYSFIQSLIIPEIEINEIVGVSNPDYINQQVDFFLPQAKLIIEIDGQQHNDDIVQVVTDSIRDNYLINKGFRVIRISTFELQNNLYQNKIKDIIDYLSGFEPLLKYYREAYDKIKYENITEKEVSTKLIPTAIIRFQILIIELLLNNYLKIDEEWHFNIYTHEYLDNYIELAVEDTFIWLENLWKLKNKSSFKRPKLNITKTNDINEFRPNNRAININFSLFKRFTDENKLNSDILYVRTDYFDILKERNHFKVSTTKPINYNIVEDDKSTLEFFLQNIFGKQKFREGQFPIIANVLNRNDTIGLLPTGGGKSLCYQLPCLLQPSINFVVCPIKSLMYDQNENLKNMLVTNIAFITSDLEAAERNKVESDYEYGKYLFVFISPEKFQIPSFREIIQSILSRHSIAYAVIDEVHCLSEWGHDFRTSYLNLAKTIDNLSPKDENGEGQIKFIGLTATASVNVLKDIKIEFSRQKDKLADENIKSLLDYSRKELVFDIVDSPNKLEKLDEILEELVDTENLTETNDKSALIFTPNVNGAYGCYYISNHINTIYQNKSSFYSGQIPTRPIYNNYGTRTGSQPAMSNEQFKEHKINVQKAFKNDHIPILVATKAFGMGIDKNNIHYTIHYGLPSSVEALYQEAGRAGRWDKGDTINKNKKAKCFVLYTPESLNNNRIDRLFQVDTTFQEMKTISEEAGWNGKDVFKQIFLFIQGQKDINENYILILDTIKFYFKKNSTVQIFWHDAYNKLGINNETLQQIIYRLSLLGIVSDWTTNFINNYEVDFVSIDNEHVINNITKYINKYEPDKSVRTEIEKIDKPSVLEKSIWYLLNWIFENIAYNRKQSLKTLVDWSNEFQDSESFKKRIDNYFKFTESTFILQHISENPNDYKSWFNAFTLVVRDNLDPNKINETIYLPGIENIKERDSRFQTLRDSTSRFLESYQNNNGLNIISGLTRLFLNDYDDPDGRQRFESAISNIKTTFNTEIQEFIIQEILKIGAYLNVVNREALSISISLFYPEKLELLAKVLNLDYLLYEVYNQKVNELSHLNNKLYEQFGKFQ
jgi:ATP-dependent DNA helicase RecQ